MMTVLWEGCGSGLIQVLGGLCTGRGFFSIKCLLGLSQLGSSPRWGCGSEMLLQGRLWFFLVQGTGISLFLAHNYVRLVWV